MQNSFWSPEDMFPLLKQIPVGPLVEFGTYAGNTLCRFIHGYQQAGQPLPHVFALDSFEGLPAETPGCWRSPDWPVGAFDARAEDALNVATVDEAVAALSQKLLPYKVPFTIIPGFFEKSLTPELGHRMAGASVVHFDCDLYVSTRQALDFCFEYNIIRPATLVRFDDILSTPWGTAGQSRACIESLQKYQKKFYGLASNVFVLGE